MKNLPFIFVALLLSACSTVKIHEGSGKFFDQNGREIYVAGNPLIKCYDRKGKLIAEGKLVRCNYDNSLTIDLYGKGYERVYHPTCDLNPEQ